MVEITFAAEVEFTYNSGFDVIDGVNEPLINSVRPIFNETNQIAGTPPSVPAVTSFDYLYPRAYEPFDVSTPSLRLGKNVEVAGVPTHQANVGDQLDYELIVANVGSAPAYVIDLQDDMGLGRLRPISGTGANLADWNFNVPAGWNCALSGTPIALDCTFAGPLAGNGALATITYSALPPHADDLVSHNTQPWNPELVENKAATPSYYGVAAPGPSDWQYSCLLYTSDAADE